MNYKGYTIEPETDPWAIKYGWHYAIGSGDDRRNFTSESEAKDWVDETLEKEKKPYLVETYVKQKAADGTESTFRMPNITKFTWLSDAVRFAVQFNGQLTTQFLNM